MSWLAVTFTTQEINSLIPGLWMCHEESWKKCSSLSSLDGHFHDGLQKHFLKKHPPVSFPRIENPLAAFGIFGKVRDDRRMDSCQESLEVEEESKRSRLRDFHNPFQRQL